MNNRYREVLHSSIPAIDISDIGTTRQFEPEYSQHVYASMLNQEYAIGDYLNNENTRTLQIT